MKTKNMSLIRTWENCYQATIGNLAGYKKRLNQLKEWDKPLVKKNEDKYGHWKEWACKKVALEGLIDELT